jgi:drug/metabolite transporter (DMT)-like permease
MTDNLILGIAIGMTASILLSVGKGVQKMKVQVLKQGAQMLSAPHRRDFGIWLLGVVMTVSASALYSVSLKFAGKSTIVASLSGIGLVGLLLFAWLVLKERVGIREIAGSVLVIIGTGLISYFNQPVEAGRQYDLHNFLYVCAALSLIFAALALIGMKFIRLHGFAFALIAGSLIGMAMILADMALVKSKGDLFGQFSNPFVYLALLSGGGALAITQVAFFKSTAVVVVPTINSFTILTPLVVEYFTFGIMLAPLQYFGVALIIAGIIVLSTSPRQIFKN